MNNLLMSTAVDFSEGFVWTFIIQLAIVFVAMLVGNLIRTRVPYVNKLLIPSAILGGMVILIIKLIPGMDGFIDVETMQIVTYHCLGMGFAAMALVTPKAKKKVSVTKIVESGAIMAGGYMIQAIVGLGISIALYYILDSFYASGLVLPMGFGQGTGSALSWGSKFETEYAFTGGASFALTIATIGFIVASVVGVVYMNVLKFKGKIKSRTKLHEEKTVGDFEDVGEIADAESIDKLTIQFCFVVFTYIIAFGCMYLLKLTGIKVLNDLAWGLNFLWSLLFAFLFKKVISICQKKKVVRHQYINNYMMDRIGGFMFDLMIISGVAAIEFEGIMANWLSILVMCLVGAVATFIFVSKATKHTFKGYETEGFLTYYGTLTGTASNGMILLREVDPSYVTPAATNLVLQNIPSIAFLAPLLLSMGFAASSLTNCFIMLGVYTLLFVAYNIFIFRRKIFKKYRSIPEEVWTETPVDDSVDGSMDNL